jgi:D-lactate dehydrogenase
MPIHVIIFSSRQYDRDAFTEANAAFGYSLQFQESQLDAQTAILAHGCTVVCPFARS